MSQRLQALELARRHGLLRASVARGAGIPGSVLSRMVREGELLRLSRGLYMLPEADITEHHDLAEAVARVPGGVVCLLSALRFHGLTTQLPHEIWLAIETRSHRPKLSDLPLRIVEMSGESFTHGQHAHKIEGIVVTLTSPAKTVADCFRFRSLVGLDVAIESLHDYLRLRAGSVDDLFESAKASRILTVMRPYIEASV